MRLTHLYTKKGDQGQTTLGDGSVIKKSALRVEALGTVDEFNSHVGLLRAGALLPKTIDSLFEKIQQELFELGAELCLPGTARLEKTQVLWVETIIDEFNSQLPPLKEFVLPGGNLMTAQCHVARALCRRLERVLVALHHLEPLNENTLCYVNRLSDLLFVMARFLGLSTQNKEVMWDKK